MAKAKIHYAVICQKHGNRPCWGDDRYKEMKVSQPLTKKQALKDGCPVCKGEKESTN